MTSPASTGAKSARSPPEQLAGWSPVEGRDAIKKSFRFPDFARLSLG